MENIPIGKQINVASFIGLEKQRKTLDVKENEVYNSKFVLKKETNIMNDVAVIGTVKEVSK